MALKIQVLLVASLAAIFYSHEVAVAANETNGQLNNKKIQVRAVKGSLDNVPMFNSNCPEVVTGEGILLSTLSPVGKAVPENHLGYTFHDGPFSIFFHHLNKQPAIQARKVLYLTLLAYNPARAGRPSSQVAKIKLSEKASFLSQPDAPFYERPVLAFDAENKLYAGPGDRVCADFLHGTAKLSPEKTFEIQPGEYAVLEHLPVPVKGLTSFSNGRSYLAYGDVEGGVQLALVATFQEADNGLDAPDLEKCKSMLHESLMARPREYEKLRPSEQVGKGRFIYGRVAGVSRGRTYRKNMQLVIRPQKEINLAYPVSSLANGTFATREIQASSMLRRYDDTAYRNHGNYCLAYKLAFQVRNDDNREHTLKLSFGTALKTDKSSSGLTFVEPPEKPMFFRGSLRLDRGLDTLIASDYFHYAMHKGQDPGTFWESKIAPRETEAFTVNLLYPPDCTPPQVVMLESD